MNGNTITQIKNMMDGMDENDIPEEITRRLLAIMILTNTEEIKKLRQEAQERHEELLNYIKSVDTRFNEHIVIGGEARTEIFNEIEKIKEDRKKNPTLVQWIREYPKKTAIIIAITFIISNVWFISGIRFAFTQAILSFLRFPPEIVAQIMDILFK